MACRSKQAASKAGKGNVRNKYKIKHHAEHHEEEHREDDEVHGKHQPDHARDTESKCDDTMVHDIANTSSKGVKDSVSSRSHAIQIKKQD